MRYTQRCVENSMTKNSIGLPLHTDERETDLDLAAKKDVKNTQNVL